MDRGVVLIAAGYSQYGNMAKMLARGIRLYSGTKIVLFCDEKALSHLTLKDKSLFDIRELPKFTYKVDGKADSYFRIKTFLPELSPFNETVFIDCDIMWHPGKNIDELFLDADFSMINEGYIDFKTGENTVSKNYQFWARPEDVRRTYELTDGKLYQYRSEFIYFKKTVKVKEYFSLSRKIYDHIKVDSLRFGDILPDEIAFGIASAILKFYPHKNNYSPIYWDYLYKFMGLNTQELYKNYYGYSMGGRQVTDTQQDFYNGLAKYYCSQYQIPQDYEWQHKRLFAQTHKALIK